VTLRVISVEELMTSIRLESVPPERIRGDLSNFLQKLEKEGLLLPEGALAHHCRQFTRPGDHTLLWDVADRQSIPLKIDLELTYRCNLRCKYCYVEAGRPTHELPIPRLVSLLDELLDMGCLFLTFTGGEPYLHHGLLDLLFEADRRWFAIRVLTNGTLLSDSAVQALSEVHRATIEISIHGSTAERHDAFTQRQGSFKAMQRGVRLLREAGIPVVLKLSITHVNAADVPNIRRLSEEWGVPLSLSPLIFPSVVGRNITEYRVNDSQLKNLMAQGEYAPRAFRCSSGRAKGWIAPDGTVYPCEFVRIPMGNVAQVPFALVWQGEAMKRFREDVPFTPVACRQCPHRMYCPRCPGIAWLEHGALHAPSLEACRHCRLWASYQPMSKQRFDNSTSLSPSEVQLIWKGRGDL